MENVHMLVIYVTKRLVFAVTWGSIRVCTLVSALFCVVYVTKPFLVVII
jgi:hypothetical protein